MNEDHVAYYEKAEQLIARALDNTDLAQAVAAILSLGCNDEQRYQVVNALQRAFQQHANALREILRELG